MIASNKPPQTLLAAVRYFGVDTACRYVAGIKWPEGPVCPECGSQNVGHIKSRNRFQCREKGCRKQFSLTTGTIMEASHLKMDQWLIAVWMIVNCRNGVSSCEIARTIGCKQQSAWHLLHRVRHVLKPDPGEEEQWTGLCEADTTYVGGLLKFMHWERRERAIARGNHGKVTVSAIKERRSGKVRAKVLQAETLGAIQGHIMPNLKIGSMLYTDKGRSYIWARRSYNHHTVDHSKEYVRGTVHTNGCENFFNCLRRGIKGTYIRPTPEHLQAYVDETSFRFNVRDKSEWERFEEAMRRVVGKRLTYSDLTDGAKR